MKHRIPAVILVLALSTIPATAGEVQQREHQHERASIARIAKKVAKKLGLVRPSEDVPTVPKPCDPNTQTCP